MLSPRHRELRACRSTRVPGRIPLLPLVAAAIALTGGLFACGQRRDADQSASRGSGTRDGAASAARVVSDSGIVAYDDSTLEFPHVQFCDGQLSLNDRCIVRQVKLNRRMPPIYVNGQPIGFC